RYRIAGLMPAAYALAASVGQIIQTTASIDLPGYAMTFYPGTPSAGESQFVAVRASEERSGIDFSLVRTKTVTISGRAEDADGEPIGGGIALLPSRRSGAVLAAAFGAHIERDGRFAFSNVGPGEYVLQVLRHRQGSWNEGESATLFLQVTDSDITDLDVRAS